MANAEQLEILKQGVEVWNRWRKKNPNTRVDLRGADLSKVDLGLVNLKGADLRRANLVATDLWGADLRGADLRKADLWGADLRDADLRKANLSEADLGEVDLREANLGSANLRRANLILADLVEADLRKADLTGAALIGAQFVRTKVGQAKISGSYVYGISIWDLDGEPEEQKNLIITCEDEPEVTVDNIEVAQFIRLVLKNEKLRDVINTITSKSVLILGRFSLPKRKKILDALKDKLREYNLLPIVFDFDRPTDKDFTETIKTLAGLSYFVIADITNPKSSPLELQATVPDYQIPFVPIIQQGEQPFAMMVDLQKKYDWVLETRTYKSKEALIKALKKGIIEPAMKKRNELRLVKAREPELLSLDDVDD